MGREAPGVSRGEAEPHSPRRGEAAERSCVALVGHVLLDDLERCTTDGRDEVAVGPQAREPGTKRGELLAQEPGRTPLDHLDHLDEAVDAELWVDADEEVDVIRHGLELDELGTRLRADLGNDLLQAGVDASALVVDDDRSAVLRAPHDVVGTAKDDVAVGAQAHARRIDTPCSYARLVARAKTVRYNYRLRVSPAQERALLTEWDGVRFVWNRCVEASKAAYAASSTEHKVTCGPAELDKMLTSWRKDLDWLRAGSSVPQQQVVRDFGRARAKALKDVKDHLPVRQRRGMPRFRSRHRSAPSLQYTTNGFSLKEDPETGRLRLHLAGGIVVRPVWSRPLPSRPSSVRVYRDAVGDWFCSFVVVAAQEPLPAVDRVIGIDWGVSVIATTTDDDHDLAHPQRRRSAEARLARYQQMMARRRPQKAKPSSKGYKEAKRQVAKLHRQVARQRSDDSYKWAKGVVVDFDQIAAEDFRPKFLARSTMAKKAADAAIGACKQSLVHMADKHGRDLRLVDPSYTTMDCSKCGARAKHRLDLSERTYACDACGAVLPRDKNSAAVMVVRAGFVPAGAEGARPELELPVLAA